MQHLSSWPGLLPIVSLRVHVDPPDAVVELAQRRMHKRFHVIGKLLAALDVAVCPDLDKHRRLRRYIVWKAIALFDEVPLEEPFVRALFYVRGLALLGRIYISMLERLA